MVAIDDNLKSDKVSYALFRNVFQINGVPEFGPFSRLFLIWKIRKGAKYNMIFFPSTTMFFAPRALPMDFVNFRDILGIDPQKCVRIVIV